MIKKYILFFLFLIITQSLFSQYIISGEVYEKSIAFPYLEVVIYDSSIKALTSNLTDEKGAFYFKVKNGSYKIEGRFLGRILFEKIVEIDKNTDLGRIEVETTLELEEVVVTGQKRLIERKVDRLIFNVENSVSVAGGNALDALKITPRIKVVNDMISMIGKGSMMILLNDRPINLSDADLSNFLKTLNAEDLKRIEVITNPPAKYSAEGNSGVINIVTKNVKNDAVNASIRNIYQQATYATVNTGGSFFIKKGRVAFNSNISYTNGSNAPEENSQIFYSNSKWDIVNQRRDFSDNFSARLGFTYKISANIESGFSLSHLYNKPLIKENEQTNIFDPLSSLLDSIIKTKASSHYNKGLRSFNFFTIFKIDSIGRKLSLDIDYFDYSNTSNRAFKAQSFFENNEPKPIKPVVARNFGIQQISNYSTNLDMEHPTRIINLNYGGRISKISTNNSFRFFDIVDQNEVLDLSQSNIFKYDENVLAVYFSGQRNFNEKWETKFGLRYEWTLTRGFSQTNFQANTNKYNKLFPTFYLAYTPSENHSFNINYGRRIQRPTYNLLNPFRVVSNPFSYSEGNPFLKPAFIDNVEFEYAFKENLITNVYFSKMYNGFEQATILNGQTNVQQVIPLNYILNQTFGINQTFIFKINDWYNFNSSINVYYSSTHSKIPQTLKFLSGWNGEFDFSNDFVLNGKKTLFANLSFNYTTRGVDNLDFNSSANQLDASLKWLLFDRRMVISLYMNDIFSSNRFTYVTFSNGIENNFRNYYDERFFRIGLILNFGGKSNIKNRESRNQDEQLRTD